MILRALFCWSIGCLALFADEAQKYDLRFRMRGEQKVSSQIVVLNLYPKDFMNQHQPRQQLMRDLGEFGDMADHFFWDSKKWQDILTMLEDHDPKKIGVTLWFSESTVTSKNIPRSALEVFKNNKVIWAATTDQMDKILVPAFAKDDLSNVGSIDLRRDEDGVIRRFYSLNESIPHLIEQMKGQRETSPQQSRVINFRGYNTNFPRITLSDLENCDQSCDKLIRGKYILISAESPSLPKYFTPLGLLSRSEILAQMLDNTLEERWIQRLPFEFYILILLVLTFFAVFLIMNYPQALTFLFFIWIATLLAALSAWAFDSFALWFPALSPSILLATTWIVFIGYHAQKIEQLNAELKKEKAYLRDLEQLKNNFVSLISHDLKTPIAKIQAITQRLKSSTQDEALRSDLDQLQVAGDELNRYIQSILKLLRVESRDFRLNREAADINELIEQVIQQLRPLSREKQIDIHTELEPIFAVELDVTLMKEVILNLIENSIKYTPSGGLIRVVTQEIDDHVIVKVIDTGQGIASDEIELVWHKFVRGSSQEHKSKGTGLGLYLVKYFIELHGGSVQLESKIHEGTTVTFTLPLNILSQTQIDMTATDRNGV